jgi:hypothetical protein
MYDQWNIFLYDETDVQQKTHRMDGDKKKLA